MTPCTTQLSFGNAIPIAVTSSCHTNHVQLPVSQSVWWTFDIGHVTLVETRIALLTIACSYCSELNNLCQTSTLVPLT